MGRWAAVVVGLALGSCGDDDGSATSSTSSSTAEATTDASTSTSTSTATGTAGSAGSSGDPADPGTFVLLTYNVAGLPQGISGSDPERYIPQMSALLNAYDVVLAQEDFWYHVELSAEATHPHQSIPWPEEPQSVIGDGLNRFSQFPFEPVERVAWYDCNGQLDCASDCLATKGWSFSRTTLAPGVELDIYNMHMEAGGCPEDVEIRQQATMDLVAAIGQRSADRAVLLAGDFNLRYTDPEDIAPLDTIVQGAGLTDVCDALACGDHDIDHIMIKNSARLQLEPVRWWVAQEFVDGKTGDALSDHPAVAVELRYVPL